MHQAAVTGAYKHMNIKPMKHVWDYARVSGEKDDKKDSIEHQHTINKNFSDENELIIVGSSEDEISGMTFERPGIIAAFNAAKAGKIDTIIIKEISRFGRERGLTLYYVDKLRQMGVRIYSVSENIDSMIESNDLIIGIKCVVNDSEPKSASRRVSSMFETIMKEKGLVCVPPFGIRKDKNTEEFYIVEEISVTVNLIHDLYQDGWGVRRITLYLTENKYLSPQYYHDLFYPGKKKKQKQSKTAVAENYWWNTNTVWKILTNPAYNGTLVCHVTARSTIYNFKKRLPSEEHIYHPDFYPKMMSMEKWNKTQTEIKRRETNGGNRSGGTVTNQKKHLFAGLLRCADCNATFTGKRRVFKNIEYTEYVCNNYHRYGLKYCSSHRVKETDLIDELYKELMTVARQAKVNIKLIDSMLKTWQDQKGYASAIVTQTGKKIDETSNTIKELLLAMAKSPQRADFYEQLIAEQEAHLEHLKSRLKETAAKVGPPEKELKLALVDYERIIKNALLSKELTPKTLSQIINKIIIKETDSELHISYELALPFHVHRRLYNEVALPFNYLQEQEQAGSNFYTSYSAV